MTVVFADLTGSTQLAERLDPEDMRAILSDVFDALAREVLKLDATVDKYIGDEIMAVFGAPLAHEDDAARAVTAALGMLQAMSALNVPLERRYGTRLGLRVGINTGEVVSGVILGGELQAAYTVVGDAVNTAKRVQSAAEPGEIIVGERTRQATARSFEYASLPPIVAKGKGNPVPVFRLVRALADEPTAKTQPARVFVGRAAERATLLAAIGSASERRGGVLAILGDPGIGKTRLLSEGRAAARAAGLTWLQGQTSSYGQTMSYLPFREMLRSFAGIDASDPEDVKWTKLEAMVEKILPGQAHEILPYLGTVLALRVPDPLVDELRDLDAEAVRRQVLRSVYLLFDGLGRSAPAVVAFEDWHWADRSSEQLLTHLLPLADRLLFVWTGRNEHGTATERAAEMSRSSARDYHELQLAPLSPDEGAALARAALGTKTLPPGLQEAVVQRSEGNPFFTEEILRALRDLGALRHDDARGEWILGEERDSATLPTTVQGVIAARLDRLSAEAREVAGVAAVIGRSFSYRTLLAVGSGLRNVELGLEELSRQSLIRERRVDEREYAFAHALIQETVYAGMLVRHRRELHARVAAAIELQAGPDREEHYGLLAYHYAQAEDWPKAQDYLFKVGDQSLRIAADAEAVGHYERALDAYARAFGDRWDPSARATIERKIGEARYRLGEFERATRHLDRSLELLGAGRPRNRGGVRLAIGSELVRQIGHRVTPWLHFHRPLRPEVSEAVMQTLWFHQFIDYSSDLERLLYDILRTLNIAERAGPSHRTLRAYFGMTLMCHNIGLHGMGTRYASMAERMSQTIGGALATALANASLGLDDYAMGRWTAAAERLGAAARGYRAAGELEAWAGISAYLSLVLVGQGRLDEAFPIADDLERTGRIARDQRIEALGPHCRAHLFSWAGREAEAATDYDRALASYRAIPDNHLLAMAAGDAARMLVRADDLAAVRALIDEGDRVAKEHHLSGWGLTHLIAARAELLLRDAELDPARRDERLHEAERVIGKLRKQGRLHAEAVPIALRSRGSLEWLRGRTERAATAWRDSLLAAERLGSVTEALETHSTVARYTRSAADEQSAGTIAARLRERAAVPETA